MQNLRRIALLLIIILACIGVDRVAKVVAQSQLAGEPPIILANNLVRFEYTENPAAFLSFGARLSPEMQYWVFTIFASALLVGVLIYTLKIAQEIHLAVFVALALFLGGGIGNLIDRVFNEGRVIDFVSMGIGPLRTGIFNVADMAILAGFILMLLNGRHLDDGPKPVDGTPPDADPLEMESRQSEVDAG